MITDKQIEAVIRAYHGNMSIPDRTMPALIKDMRKALEAVEQSKPKPEPVAYTSRGELEDLFYQAEMKAFSDKSDINDMPLYTAPPTREPLSEDEIKDIIEDVLPHGTMGDLVRAIEKTHGIGVTND